MDWQARYEQGDTPWDKGFASPVLAELIELKPFFFGSQRHILVPGCGYGYDAVAIAETGSRVLAVDVAPLAIETAKRVIPECDGLRFALADLFKFSKSMHGQFDLVWEHTCFCAIDPSLREAYVKSMWQVLKPHGALLGVFFTNPDVGSQSGPPFKSTREEVRKAFAPYFVLEWEHEPTRFYEGREGRERVMLFRRLADCSETAC